MKVPKTNTVYEALSFSKYLESYLVELDEEDRKVLSKWRVRCIDLLNQKIRETLIQYQASRIGYEKRKPILPSS